MAGLNRRAAWRRFVLRCAFGLDLFRNERAVGLYATLHERLRATFERVGQRVSAPIAYRQSLPLFLQHEIDAAITMFNRAAADIARNPHALMKFRSGQRRKFADRVVVGLALRVADVGECQKRRADNCRANQKLLLSLQLEPPFRPAVVGILAQWKIAGSPLRGMGFFTSRAVQLSDFSAIGVGDLAKRFPAAPPS